MKLAPNRPSKRHVIEIVPFRNGFYERCLRCGRTYNPAHGGIASLYCHPHKQWLEEHPDDDKGEF